MTTCSQLFWPEQVIENNYRNLHEKLSYFLFVESEKLDLEDLIDDFISFFIAGQETTSNALAFCLMEVGQNPEVFKK
jgi:cytochrome P450